MNKKYGTQADLARILGIYPSQISQLIVKGVLAKTAKGLLNLEKSIKIIEDNRKAHLNTSNQTNLSYTEARTRNEHYKAKITELEYKKLKGELVSVQDVVDTSTKIVSVTKTRLLSIPGKLAPQLVELKSAKKIHNIIRNEIIVALNELAKLKNV